MVPSQNALKLGKAKTLQSLIPSPGALKHCNRSY